MPKVKLFSQEMQVAREIFVRLEFVFLSVCAYLVSVHAHHGYLDGANKVEIIVAQVIGGRLKLVLVHLGRVVDHPVKYRLGCSHCRFVRNEEEIEGSVALNFYQGSVYDSAGAGIQIFGALFVEKTMLNVAIH